MIQKTEAWEKIDPTKKLTKKDFETLFSHLPLNLYEKERLRSEYWPAYEKFIEAGVDPKTSWIATKNLFVKKESQIGERIKQTYDEI